MAKLTDKQEKYIQELLKPNTSQRKAYRIAYPSSLKWKDSAVDSCASTLLSNAKVTQRYNQLKDKIDKRIEKKFVLTIDNILEDIIDTRATCKDNMLKMDREGNWSLDSAAVSGRDKTNEMLGKFKKMFTDKLEIDANITVNKLEDFFKD